MPEFIDGIQMHTMSTLKYCSVVRLKPESALKSRIQDKVKQWLFFQYNYYYIRVRWQMGKAGILLTLILLFQALIQTCRAAPSGDTDISESDYMTDLPVVLTATRLHQPKSDSPVATTIIDRDMIEASGFTEIADLLRLAPGMLVNYDSGHVANAGYMFLFDRYRVRLQVLIDGMSVYTPLLGEMPWTQLGISIDDIERIEVIRGPSSASYGPNAMTGVVSIITRHAALDQGLRVKANQGVNGRSEQFLTYGNSSGDLDYRLSLGARSDDGFERRYDDKDMALANFRSDYQASNSDALTFSVLHSNGDYQEDSTPTLATSMPEHNKHVRQTYLQGKWLHSFENGDSFSLDYYHQSHDDDNTYLGDLTSEGLGYIFINESVETRRDNLEFSYSMAGEFYNITAGALYRVDNTMAPEYLHDVDINIDTRQVYVNSAISLGAANILNLGLLYDDNDTAGATTSPRIALNHHIDANQTVRASYAESYRSPFALEEYTNRVVYVPVYGADVTVWADLVDLKPEKIRSADLGYLVNTNDNATQLDLRIYRSWITDAIVQDGSIGGGFVQGDAFHISGFEASLSQQLSKTRLILNYTYTKIRADDLVYGNPAWYETGAPENTISMLLIQNFENHWSGSLGYYYTGTYQQLCCETDLQNPRERIDMTLTKSFHLGKYNSYLKIVLQNITDEHVETRLFNDYDRQGYISFGMQL